LSSSRSILRAANAELTSAEPMRPSETHLRRTLASSGFLLNAASGLLLGLAACSHGTPRANLYHVVGGTPVITPITTALVDQPISVFADWSDECLRASLTDDHDRYEACNKREFTLDVRCVPATACKVDSSSSRRDGFGTQDLVPLAAGSMSVEVTMSGPVTKSFRFGVTVVEPTVFRLKGCTNIPVRGGMPLLEQDVVDDNLRCNLDIGGEVTVTLVGGNVTFPHPVLVHGAPTTRIEAALLERLRGTEPPGPQRVELSFGALRRTVTFDVR
jgi:hypothetical protein